LLIPAARSCQSLEQPTAEGSQLVLGLALLALVGAMASQKELASVTASLML
jgi:hypothetical protein